MRNKWRGKRSENNFGISRREHFPKVRIYSSGKESKLQSYQAALVPLAGCVSLMGKLLGLLGKPYATMYLQMRLLNPACKRVYKVLSC